MDRDAELATAGLVVAFAAVLLVASHLFIEFKSAKRLITSSTDPTISTQAVPRSL
jgi:hypothetical protein